MAEVSTAPQGSRIAPDALPEGPLVGAARAAEAAARRVKEKVAEAKDQISEKSIGELVDNGKDFVRENPGKTILLSIGVGALVGYLIGRRRS